MIFKKIDMLSPPITLFFKGDNSHSSIFSGILTIVAYIIIVIFGVYYSLDFIQKKNPSVFFFDRYIEDSGEFTLNSSSIFHYIELRYSLNPNIVSSLDFDMIRIIGLESITIDNYPITNLENTPHWLYGLCNNSTDTENIGYLITSEQFFSCACIRKYYDPNTKKYYNTNENKFIWPSIKHGMSNSANTFYGVIVEKCKNDELRTISGLGSCKDTDEINNYIYSQIITMYLIDHYSDVLNYHKPFTKYLYSVSNILFPNSYTVNNMNFNPSMIQSHNGIFFDNIIKEFSYLFTQNEKVTMDEEIEVIDENGNLEYDESGNTKLESTGIVSSYYFWLQNRLQFYERIYKRLQDTLSSIGGISRTVFLVAIFINSIVSNYFILLDTEKLYLSLNMPKEKKIIKPFNKDKKILCTPKRHYYYNNNFRAKHEKMIKEDADICNNFQSENERIMRNKNLNIKRNNLVNNLFEPSRLENQNEIIINNKQINKRIKFDKYQKRYDIKKQYNNNLYKTDNDKNEENIKSKKRNSFSFWRYIKYIICCKRNNSVILFYEDYRAKYISEEEIIHCHLNLSLLINSYKLE